MTAMTRALVGHVLFVICLFGPVALFGAMAAPFIGLPTEMGALGALGVFFAWIGWRAGQTEVWADAPRR